MAFLQLCRSNSNDYYVIFFCYGINIYLLGNFLNRNIYTVLEVVIFTSRRFQSCIVLRKTELSSASSTYFVLLDNPIRHKC